MSEAREGLMFKSLSSNPLFESRSWKNFYFFLKIFYLWSSSFPFAQDSTSLCSCQQRYRNGSLPNWTWRVYFCCYFTREENSHAVLWTGCTRLLQLYEISEWWVILVFWNVYYYYYHHYFFLFVVSLFVFGRNALIIRIMEKSWVLIVEIVIRVSQRV